MLQLVSNTWRIVIHGGIDCYSRMPLYLKAFNNKADTVMTLFDVNEYGLSSRVTSDKGENINVSTYMLSHVTKTRENFAHAQEKISFSLQYAEFLVCSMLSFLNF